MTEIDRVRGGTGRAASTLELFFDLVYVFAITQVVALIHAEPEVIGFAKGALLLLFLWWTWSIYTWTTNWTGTDSGAIKLFILAAMGATLFMALGVPESFDGNPAAFAIPYFVVRMLAAGLYWFASKDYPIQRAAFMTFFPASGTAAALVLVGGFLEQPWTAVLWIASALLDVISAANAGRGTWAVDASHFAERNGLFVIIALGETIVGIGLAAAGAEGDGQTAATVLAFLGAAALWWSYFAHAAPKAEAYLVQATGQESGRFARDAYTVLHYPLVVGIVFFAVAAEAVVLHPNDPLPVVERFALAIGIALVMLSIVAAIYRAVRRVPVERLVAALGLVVLGWVGETMPAVTFAASAVFVLIAALLVERFYQRLQPEMTLAGG